jgi:hypothetical protein
MQVGGFALQFRRFWQCWQSLLMSSDDGALGDIFIIAYLQKNAPKLWFSHVEQRPFMAVSVAFDRRALPLERKRAGDPKEGYDPFRAEMQGLRSYFSGSYPLTFS